MSGQITPPRSRSGRDASRSNSSGKDRPRGRTARSTKWQSGSEEEKKVERPDFRQEIPTYDVKHVEGAPTATVFRSGKPYFALERYKNLTEEQEKLLSEWWDIKSLRTKDSMGHPWLATTRNVAEAWVVNQCMLECVQHGVMHGIILDVGGSGQRHHDQKRPFVHSCNPDYTKAKQNACNQTVLNCLKTCFPFKVGEKTYDEPVITFSTHSLYYLTDEELAQTLYKSLSNVHYAIVHRYPEKGPENKISYHSFKEMKWWRSNGRIVAHARGNINQYIHPNLEWLFTTGMKIFCVKDKFAVIRATLVKTFGDHQVMRLVMSVQDDPPIAPEFIPPPEEEEEVVYVEINKTKYHPVLVDTASAWLLGNDRTKLSSKKVFAAQFPVYFNKNHPTIGFPTSNTTKAITDLFSYVVPELEADLSWANPAQKDNLASLEHVRNGGLAKVSYGTSLMVGVGVLGGTLCAAKVIGSKKVAIAAVPVAVMAGAMHFLKVATDAGYTKLSHSKYLTTNLTFSIWGSLRRLASISFKWIKELFFPKVRVTVIKTMDTCIPAPLKPTHPEATVVSPPIRVCYPKRVQQVMSFYMPCSIPQRPRQCDHTVQTAVHNRCVPDYSRSVDWSVDMLPQWLLDDWKMVAALMRKLDTDDEWYPRMPPKKQEKYRKDVRDFYEHTRIMNSIDCREGFPKDEFSINKSEISGRMIQACQSAYNELVGPWIVALSNAMATVFDENNPNLFYATKTTGEAVGLRTKLQHMRGCSFAKNDMHRWDAHMHESARNIEHHLCRLAGFPEDIIELMQMLPGGDLKLKGGWKVKYRNGRFSGEPQTSCFNTILIAIVTHQVANRLGSSVELTVLGDDTVLAFPEDFKLDETNDAIAKEEFSRYGLNAKFEMCSLEDLEFCSSVFYPNDGDLLLSWKLGRAAAKMQWDKKNLCYADLKTWSAEVALGSRNNASTIPILKELFENVLDKFRAEKALTEGWEEKINMEHYHPYDDSTVEFLAQRYRVAPEMIRQEALRVRHADFPLALEGPLWERISLVDNGGTLFAHDQPLLSYNWDATLNVYNALKTFDFWHSAFIGPVYEEVAKRKFPVPAVLTIATIEGLAQAATTWPAEGIEGLSFLQFATLCIWFRGAVHFSLSLLPIKWGVALHSIINIGIMVSTGEIFLPPSEENTNHDQPLAPQEKIRVEAPALNVFSAANILRRLLAENLMPRKSKQTRRRSRNAPPTTVVVKTQAKKPKKKAKKTRRTRGAMHPYLCARINPFMASVNGIRAPDEFGYPTGTAVVRVSTLLQSNSTGYASCLYTPFTNTARWAPLNTTAGTITWAGGSAIAAPQDLALVDIATVYRTVAWGIRITADSSLTNSQGHVWIAHVPNDVVTTPYGGAPTTEAQVAALPDCEKFSVTNLAQQPIVVAGRPVDDGIYRFRSTAPFATSATTIESFSGWCNIIVYLSGALANVTALNVEIIQHIEYIQDGSSLYGFIDTIPGAYQPQLMVEASKIDQALPVGILDSVVNTAEGAAELASRVVGAGLRIGAAVTGAMRAAGIARQSIGYLHAPASIPRLTWDDEKY